MRQLGLRTHIGRAVRLVIMGPPGAGKGTVSQRIVTDFGVTHLSSGDFLRDEIRAKSALGQQAQSYIEKGQLVPDMVITHIMLDKLSAHRDVGCLVDGFPRTLHQAEIMEHCFPISCAIELKVPFEVIIDRLRHRWVHAPSGRVYNLDFNPPKVPGKDDVTGEPLTQRDDDRAETVAKRLHSYELWERDVAKYFRDHRLLASFSGTTTNELWPMIFDFLESKVQPLKKTDWLRKK